MGFALVETSIRTGQNQEKAKKTDQKTQLNDGVRMYVELQTF